ncbi:MAG: phenylalanine--tRNA ligase beta subunit-related protein [Candidatus Hadarchaeales archaeon]
MWLKIEEKLAEKFPGLRALIRIVRGVRVETESAEVEGFKQEMIEEVKRSMKLEEVKDVPIFRAYRDFYWRIGIDPTKIRPAGEALVRRVLGGKPIPKINTLVDVYNAVSLRTGVAIGAFDFRRIEGELLLREAVKGEKFLGIGMKAPETLSGNEVVVADAKKLIAIYPYRDAEETKITTVTTDVLFLICGVPGISEETLQEVGNQTVEMTLKFCGGRE